MRTVNFSEIAAPLSRALVKLVNRLTIRPATLPDGDFPRGVRGRRTDFRLVSVIIFPSMIRPTFQCFTFTADHVANDPLVIGRKVVLFVFGVGDDQQDDPELFKIEAKCQSKVVTRVSVNGSQW